MSEIRGALIEIVERRKKPAEDSLGASVVVPNEVRINGQQIAMPQGAPITIGEVSSDDVVTVTLTVFARRIFVGHEDIDESVTNAVAAATTRLIEARKDAADSHVRYQKAIVEAQDQLGAVQQQLARATEADA